MKTLQYLFFRIAVSIIAAGLFFIVGIALFLFVAPTFSSSGDDFLLSIVRYTIVCVAGAISITCAVNQWEMCKRLIEIRRYRRFKKTGTCPPSVGDFQNLFGWCVYLFAEWFSCIVIILFYVDLASDQIIDWNDIGKMAIVAPVLCFLAVDSSSVLKRITH